MLVVMIARAALLIAALVACGSQQRSRMYPAGSDKDDGYGDLAQKSAHLFIGGGSDAPFAPHAVVSGGGRAPRQVTVPSIAPVSPTSGV